MLVAIVESGFCGPHGFGHGEIWVARGRRDEGEAGSQRSVVETGIEDGGSQTLGRGAIAMSFGDSFDQAMQAEAALARVRARLAELGQRDPPIDIQFSMPDQWSRHLFLALCRRYGLQP